MKHKHVGWYLRGFSIGGEARRALNLVSTREELRAKDSLNWTKINPIRRVSGFPRA